MALLVLSHPRFPDGDQAMHHVKAVPIGHGLHHLPRVGGSDPQESLGSHANHHPIEVITIVALQKKKRNRKKGKLDWQK